MGDTFGAGSFGDGTFGTGSTFSPPANLVSIRLVDIHGNVTAVLTDSMGTGTSDAQLKGISWRLNGTGTMQFDVPKDNAYVGDIKLMQTEVQAVYNGTVIFWGVVWRVDSSGSVTNVQAKTLDSYFDRRYVGKPDRTNWVTNGDFSSGTLGSMPTGWAYASGVSTYTTGYQSSTYSLLNGKSLEIRCTGRNVDTRSNGAPVDSPTDPDDYSGPDESVVQWVQNTYGTGQLFQFAAWFMIRDDATFNWKGKPFDGRGFYVEAWDSTKANWTGRSAVTPISDKTPRNEWVRATVDLWLEANEWAMIRLYPVAGTSSLDSGIVWDDVGMYLFESLSFYSDNGTDLTDIIEGLVAHAQDTTYGKTDLNITPDPSNSATGYVANVAYQHVDHDNILRAINAFVESDQVDWDITWDTGAVNRYVTVATQIGSVKSSYNLTIDGASSNVIDARYAEDGNEYANSILITSRYSGPSRKESGARNVASGEQAWEYIGRLDSDHGIDWLARQALDELSQRQTINWSLTVRLAQEDFPSVDHPVIGLSPGDWVSVTSTWGRLNWSTKSMRIIRKSYDPSTNITTLELNES